MSTRTERDSFGPIEVPADRLWGAQTQRSLGNFRISGERLPLELVRALVLVKKATALVYIDLPLLTHFRWVTKRFLKGLFVTPEGWPQGSPMFSSTIHSYRVLWLCHRNLTPKYRELISEAWSQKRVHHLRSPREISAFLNAVRSEARGGADDQTG